MFANRMHTTQKKKREKPKYIQYYHNQTIISLNNKKYIDNTIVIF